MKFNKEVFAANLRAARAKLDITQDEFASRVGISKDSVVKYESGEGYIPALTRSWLSVMLPTSALTI